jgi:2',3'-cyclic-nucleotide 2'-phosphodiesterase (5'-nucleotidase family)
MAAMKKSSRIVLLLSVLSLIACNTIYRPQSVAYADYRVAPQPVTDSSLVYLLSPYSSRMYASMNEVIATVGVNLEKKQPEGTLGNVMVDVMLMAARKKFGQPVDIAVMNYGGIRQDQIPPGPLTRGKLFELSPFDNTIVLMSIKGSALKQFLDHIASRGGWPVAGVRMKITDKKATDITINGKPLDESMQYSMALLDYVANGGDESFMLRELPRQDKGFLFREELQEYFMQLQREGKSITSSVEGRITSN